MMIFSFKKLNSKMLWSFFILGMKCVEENPGKGNLVINPNECLVNRHEEVLKNAAEMKNFQQNCIEPKPQSIINNNLTGVMNNNPKNNAFQMSPNDPNCKMFCYKKEKADCQQQVVTQPQCVFYGQPTVVGYIFGPPEEKSEASKKTVIKKPAVHVASKYNGWKKRFENDAKLPPYETTNLHDSEALRKCTYLKRKRANITALIKDMKKNLKKSEDDPSSSSSSDDDTFDLKECQSVLTGALKIEGYNPYLDDECHGYCEVPRNEGISEKAILPTPEDKRLANEELDSSSSSSESSAKEEIVKPKKKEGFWSKVRGLVKKKKNPLKKILPTQKKN